jgi:hypothetical protein
LWITKFIILGRSIFNLRVKLWYFSKETIKKTFLSNLNDMAEKGYDPIWRTFKEEFVKDKNEWYYYVIVQRERKPEEFGMVG